MTVKQLIFLILGLTLAAALGFIGFWQWEQKKDQKRFTILDKNPAAEKKPEDLFPTGETVPPTNQEDLGEKKLTPLDRGQNNEEPLARQQITLSLFSKIFSRPTAGAFAPQAGKYLLIFADRATGHIYALGPEPETLIRLSNTTTPKVYQFFGGATDGEIKIISRRLANGRQQNFIGDLVLATTTSGFEFEENVDPLPLTNRALPAAIFDLAVSPDQKNVFYLEKTAGGSRGVIVDFAFKNSEEIFASVFNEWRTHWATSSLIALQTKASARAPGSLYWLNPKNKNRAPEPVITDLPGLSALTSPALDYVLYSAGGGSPPNSGLFNVKTGVFERLPISVLADKCVWSKTGRQIYCAAPADWPSGVYPDDWFSGQLKTADRFWQIEVPSKKINLLFDPGLGGLNQEIDAANLILDRSENYLFLVNKNDLSLWGLNLKPDFLPGD